MSRPVSATGSNPPTRLVKAPSQTSRENGQSNITLFISNLRLLDLNRRRDWPDIVAQNFETKSSAQDQKKRISCVEWALFRLFEIYDGETTRDKLQPFFPPLEPLQSLNLRAALFRCLNDLKKNGLLGREAILRKTMLDECKGEKFEEILVLFSAAVVRKKVLASRHKSTMPIAQTLSTATTLNSEELKHLSALSLAHRVALQTSLDARAKHNLACGDLHLAMLEQQYQLEERRDEPLGENSTNKEHLPHEVQEAILSCLKQNWTGSSDGYRSLIEGGRTSGSRARSHALQVKAHSILGNSIKIQEESAPSLLEDLSARISVQDKRLRELRSYHDRLKGLQKDQVESASEQRTTERTTRSFVNHHILRVGMEISTEDITKPTSTPTTCSDIVQHMRSELRTVTTQRQGSSSNYHANDVNTDPVNSTSKMNATPHDAEDSRFDAGYANMLELKPASLSYDLFSPLKRNLPFKQQQAYQDVDQAAPLPETSASHQEFFGGTAETADSSELCNMNEDVSDDHATDEAAALTDENDSDERAMQESTSDLASAFEQVALNANDVATAPNAVLGHKNSRHPSIALEYALSRLTLEETTKQEITKPTSSDSTTLQSHPAEAEDTKPLSLDERTRISMAQSSKNAANSAQTSASQSPDLPFIGFHPIGTPLPILDKETSLADRALQSMTAAAATGLKRAQSKRESKTTALYPVNQFSTPGKAKQSSTSAQDADIEETIVGEIDQNAIPEEEADEGMDMVGKRNLTPPEILFSAIPEEEADEGMDMVGKRNLTPPEILFSDDAEYASVFKSRPKIGMSTLMSPGLDRSEEESSPLSGRWGF